MTRFQLTEIVTKDGIVHQGIYYEPDKKSQTAILWVHGLTSTFYADVLIFEILISIGKQNGIGLAAFNNRGHDMITGFRKVDPKNPSGYGHIKGGAGYEKFEDCVNDIDAGITFLQKQGFKKIYLIGHSTGAFKVGYYAGTVIDQRLAGLVVASPTSDRLIEVKTNKKLAVNLRRMAHMIKKGKGEYLVNNLTFFPLTPKRYLSLFSKNSIEETIFDYGSKKPDLKIFRNIKIPLLVILAQNDEFIDRPIEDIKNFYDKHQKSVNYKSTIIKNAVHGYDGLEDMFAEAIIKWINNQKQLK